MPAIVFKQIKPGRLNEAILVDELLKGMEETGEEIKAEFEKTTRTWRHKPEFEILSDLNPNGPEVLVATDDKVYKFLDEGTSVRYATMTPDFQAKTMPGIIDSRTGKGGVAFIDRRRPRPGIEARNFSEIIQKNEQPCFKRRMERAMSEARRKSGHAI